jgi:hypothetical protein
MDTETILKHLETLLPSEVAISIRSCNPYSLDGIELIFSREIHGTTYVISVSLAEIGTNKLEKSKTLALDFLTYTYTRVIKSLYLDKVVESLDLF